MRVVWVSSDRTDTVTDDFDHLINKLWSQYYTSKIARVELNDQDFLHYCVMNQGMFDKVCISLEWDKNLEPSYSGSYVVYKGVCIQTHESYKD